MMFDEMSPGHPNGERRSLKIAIHNMNNVRAWCSIGTEIRCGWNSAAASQKVDVASMLCDLRHD